MIGMPGLRTVFYMENLIINQVIIKLYLNKNPLAAAYVILYMGVKREHRGLGKSHDSNHNG
jgi:hypothetical protein